MPVDQFLPPDSHCQLVSFKINYPLLYHSKNVNLIQFEKKKSPNVNHNAVYLNTNSKDMKVSSAGQQTQKMFKVMYIIFTQFFSFTNITGFTLAHMGVQSCVIH